MTLVIELSPTVVGSEWIIPSIKGPSHSNPSVWNSEIYYDWNDMIGVGANNGDVVPNNPSGNSYIFVLKNIKTKNNDNTNATGCLFEIGGTYGFVMGTSLEDPSKFKISVGQYPSENISIEVSMSEFDNGNETHEIVGYLDTSSSNKISLYIDGIEVGETSGNVSTRFWGTGDGKFGGPNGVSSNNGIASTGWSETSNEEKMYIYKYNNSNAPIINYRSNLGKDSITNEELKNSLSINSGSGTIVEVTGTELARTINVEGATDDIVLNLSYNINGDIVNIDLSPEQALVGVRSITVEEGENGVDYEHREVEMEIEFTEEVNDLLLSDISVDNGGIIINLVKEGIKWKASVEIPNTLTDVGVDYKISVNYNGVTGEVVKNYNTYIPIIGGVSALEIKNNVPESVTENEKGFIVPSLSNVDQLKLGSELEKRLKRKEFVNRLLKKNKEVLKGSEKKLVMSRSELIGENEKVGKDKLKIIDSYDSEGVELSEVEFDTNTLEVDEGLYVPLSKVGDSVILEMQVGKLKIKKVSESSYEITEDYVDETSVVSETKNEGESGDYGKLGYVLGSVAGEIESLSSITMEDIVGPKNTGTLTIRFNQSISETNMNGYVTLEPSYIGSIGEIISVDGGVTWTGTVTRSVEMNKLDNKVVLNYLGVDGEASYEVLENVSMKEYSEWSGRGSVISQVEEERIESSALSSDGKIMAIGNGQYGLDGVGNRGSVKVYSYNGSEWVQMGDRIDGDAEKDLLGYSVALSNNGLRILIGAPNASQSQNSREGEVRIYDYDGIQWQEVGVIEGVEEGGRFGASVTLSGEGNKLGVGSHYFGLGDDIWKGSMRAYAYDGTNWNQMGSALEGENVGDGFGKSVSVSEDGLTIAVGAPNYKGGYDGRNTEDGYKGQVKIYEYVNNNWSQIGETIYGEKENKLGWEVKISSNGKIVGMEVEHYNNENRLKVYENVNGTWTQLGSDIMQGIVRLGGLRSPLSLSGDGKTISCTTHRDADGTTNIFEYENGEWSQIGESMTKTDYAVISRDGKGLFVRKIDSDRYTHSGLNYHPTYGLYNYSREESLVREIRSIKMNDTTIKYPESGSEFEIKMSTNEKTLEELGSVSLEPLDSGSVSGVSLSRNGYSIVGTYSATSGLERSGNKLKYVEGEISGEVEFVLSTLEKAISNICFYGESEVLTNEGYVKIREVKRGMKVQGEEIEEITVTKTEEKEIVLMKAGSIMNKMPLKDTRITKEHKVLYKGVMVEAKELLNGSTIVYEKYEGENLYNILLSGEGKMVVNGMIVETLSPSNNVSKLYKILRGYREEEKREIVKIYNEERNKKRR